MPLSKRTPNIGNFEELEHAEDFFSLEDICFLKKKETTEDYAYTKLIRMSISLMKHIAFVKNYLSVNHQIVTWYLQINIRNYFHDMQKCLI